MASDSKLADLVKLEKQYGEVFRLSLGSQLAIIVTGKAIKEAFVTKAADFAGRPSLYSVDIYSHGGKASNVAIEDYSPRWRLPRKIVLSALKMYTTDLPKQASLTNNEFHRLLQGMESKYGQPQDITKDILLAVTNVFCAMVFGSRYELDDPEFTRLVEVESGMFHLLTDGFVVDVLPWLSFFPFKSIQTLKEMCHERDEIHGRSYREHVEANRIQNPRDLTDALLKARKEAEEEDASNQGIVTDQDIIMLMNEVFIASMVNIANTLNWALLYLIHNPEVQEMLHEELDQVVGPTRLPDIEDKNNLPFLEATITETLRISSVIPLSVPRKTTVDTTLQGYHIPKDTTVFANVWSLHHNPDIWDAPNDFRPQRFLDKDGKFVPPSADHFIRFGIGLRDCLGTSMTMVELHLVLARMLHTFKLENPPGCDLPSLEPGTQGLAIGPKPFKFCAIKRHDV